MMWKKREKVNPNNEEDGESEGWTTIFIMRLTIKFIIITVGHVCFHFKVSQVKINKVLFAC